MPAYLTYHAHTVSAHPRLSSLTYIHLITSHLTQLLTKRARQLQASTQPLTGMRQLGINR